MKKLVAATIAACFALAPLGAVACGDSMSYATPEQLGMKAPAPATRAPDTMAKATVQKAAKPAAQDAKASPHDGKLKVASNR